MEDDDDDEAQSRVGDTEETESVRVAQCSFQIHSRFFIHIFQWFDRCL